MQTQAFRGPILEEDNIETMRLRGPIRVLKKERDIQIRRVKKIFPYETGVIKNNFFSSRILQEPYILGTLNDIINLAVLIDQLFNNGSYKVVETDLRMRRSYNTYTLKRQVSSFGPAIKFYLERDDILAGILNAQMSLNPEDDKFYGTNAEIVKLQPKFVYQISPIRLKKINLSTGKVEQELSLSYERSSKRIATFELTRPLTTQEALTYLTKDLGLTN
jgi:hypothetical protein